MTPECEAVLSRLDQRRERERGILAEISSEEFDTRINEFMLPVGPEVGRMMNLLVKAARPETLLELGTSVGYSTLWLADAAREVGGHVVTLDAVPDKHEQARANLRQAGLEAGVTFVMGDAVEWIGSQPGPFGFVLLDVWKSAYLPCYEALLPKLAPGAIVVADNMLRPESARTLMEAYQARVRGTPGMDSLLLPIGNGIELSRLNG